MTPVARDRDVSVVPRAECLMSPWRRCRATHRSVAWQAAHGDGAIATAAAVCDAAKSCAMRSASRLCRLLCWPLPCREMRLLLSGTFCRSRAQRLGRLLCGAPSRVSCRFARRFACRLAFRRLLCGPPRRFSCRFSSRRRRRPGSRAALQTSKDGAISKTPTDMHCFELKILSKNV